MQWPTRQFRLLCLLVPMAATVSASVGHAQPTIPKEEIPSNILPEVRKQLEGLYSSDSHERATAAAILGNYSQRAVLAIPFLMAMLHDDAVLHDERELEMRRKYASVAKFFFPPNSPGQEAAMALGDLARREGKPTTDDLIARLADSSPAARANAVGALGQMLREMSRERRRTIAQSPGLSAALIGALRDDHADVRKWTAMVLGALEDLRAVEPLIAVLKGDESWEVRKAVVAELGGFGDPRAVEPLIGTLEGDDSQEVRQVAAAALERIGDPRAVDSLIRVLDNPREPVEVRRHAAGALGAIRDARGVQSLIVVLRDPAGEVDLRSSAAGALAKIGDRRAIEPLIEALEDSDARVRCAALSVADLLDDYRLLRPLLVDALQDEDSQVRQDAARVATRLGKLNDPAAFDLLATALKDDHPDVRANAARSLAELKDPRAVPLLIAALQKDNSYVRQHVAYALGELGDAQAVGPLTEALKDADILVRIRAREALKAFDKAVDLGQF